MTRPRLLSLLCCWIALSIAAGAILAGETAAANTIYELRERLVVDADDGRLDDFTLLEGVLIAGGVEEQAALQRYLSIWRQHRAEAIAESAEFEGERRGGQLFDYLHDRILTGQYLADRTELDLTLADGSYNCVTATVLYCELCQAAGITARAVAAPGHVFAQIDLGEPPTPIETTCEGWFSLLTDEQRQQALDERRGKQAGEERVLSDVELIAKIFYNRGVFQLQRDHYAEAIALIRLSLRLDPRDTAAQANLLAAFNNWALAECEQKHWTEAIQLIEAGLGLDSRYEALLANELHAYHGLAMHLCSAGRYAEAADLLEQGFQRRPDAPLFDDGRFAVYQSWVESLMRQGRTEEARQVLSRAYRIDARRAERIRHRLGA